jgi:hypothetical protein
MEEAFENTLLFPGLLIPKRKTEAGEPASGVGEAHERQNYFPG